MKKTYAYVVILTMFVTMFAVFGCGNSDAGNYSAAPVISSAAVVQATSPQQLIFNCVSFGAIGATGTDKCMTVQTAGSDWVYFDAGSMMPGNKQLVVSITSPAVFKGKLSIDNPCGLSRSITPFYINAGETTEASFMTQCNDTNNVNVQKTFTVIITDDNGNESNTAFVSYSLAH